MIPEPADAAMRRRYLIVKINHLAERITPYITAPISDTTAVLYQVPELNRNHTRWVTDIVKTLEMPAPAHHLRNQLCQALNDLETILPPAPAPSVALTPPPVVIALPTAKPTSARRGRLTRLMAAISRRLRREPTFSPEARRAAAAIMACTPSGRPA